MAKLPHFLASLLLLTSLGGAGASALAGVPTLVTHPSVLKVHKRENFLGSDIEICTFS